MTKLDKRFDDSVTSSGWEVEAGVSLLSVPALVTVPGQGVCMAFMGIMPQVVGAFMGYAD